MTYKGKTSLFYVKDDSLNKKLVVDAMAKWEKGNAAASNNLQKKFIVARRLRQGITTEGIRLQLPQKELSEGIVRKAEYDNLCRNIHNNLDKPGVIALAKSLHIQTNDQTKTQLCQAIAKRLI
jgi:hypothetical protein